MAKMTNNELRALAEKTLKHEHGSRVQAQGAAALAQAVLDSVPESIRAYRSPACEDRGPQPIGTGGRQS